MVTPAGTASHSRALPPQPPLKLKRKRTLGEISKSPKTSESYKKKLKTPIIGEVEFSFLPLPPSISETEQIKPKPLFKARITEKKVNRKETVQQQRCASKQIRGSTDIHFNFSNTVREEQHQHKTHFKKKVTKNEAGTFASKPQLPSFPKQATTLTHTTPKSAFKIIIPKKSHAESLISEIDTFLSELSISPSQDANHSIILPLADKA